VAKKKKLSEELKSALMRLNDILNELDLKQYPLSDRELGLLQDYITDVSEPVNHRPTRNLVRDLCIAVDVEVLLRNGKKPNAAYIEAANQLASEKDVHLEPSGIGKIYHRYIDDPFTQSLVSMRIQRK